MFQKSAIFGVINGFSTNGSTCEKQHKTYFKSHKKLGSKDRKRISNWFYTYIKHMLLVNAVYPQIDDSNVEELIALLDSLDVTSIKDKKEVITSVLNNHPDFTREQILSMPNWILDLWDSQGKDIAENMALAASVPNPTYIRFNQVNCDDKTKKACISDERLGLSLDNELQVYWSTSKQLEQSEAFNAGYFEIQDYGSQQIGVFTQAKPNEQIIDACCGAGGKGLQLASMMKNVGKIWSLDIRAKALDNYYDRAMRAGVEIAELFEVPEDPADVDFPFLADCVLMDVPCSGSGVFSRKADRKYRLKPKQLDDLIALQESILTHYSAWVKPGGRIIYATCSTFKEENQNQIAKFLQKQPEFFLDEEKLIGANEKHHGFYMARLIKKEE